MFTANEKNQLARSAFWGGSPVLYARLLHTAGYVMDGGRHDSNGLTLAECVRMVSEMPEDDLAAIVAVS